MSVERDGDGVELPRWSAWMPLMAAHPLALAHLPSGPGVYRIRRCDRPETPVVAAWAPAGVRVTVERLSRQVHLPVEPYDNSGGLVPQLRRLRADGIGIEVSGAELRHPPTNGWIERLYRAPLDR